MWKTQLTLDTGIREAGKEQQKINPLSAPDSIINNQT
jgi:hypothetical protein